MNNKKLFYTVLYPVIFILALGLDRWTKYLAVEKLSDGTVVEVIDRVFQFTYLENGGAAFGMMQGKQVLFYIITFLVCVVIIYLMFKLPKTERFCALSLTLMFVLAGAVGNFIDRISQNYVVDFIYFVPIDFPVFNVADIYVTLGCITLVILLLFVYRDSEFTFLSSKKKAEDSAIQGKNET